MRLVTVALVVAALITIIVWLLFRKPQIVQVQSIEEFSMPVDDIFATKEKKKVVVVGVIKIGKVCTGDRLFVKTGEKELCVTAEALEAFNKPLKLAKTGDRVAIMLQGIDKEQIQLPAVLVGNK